MASDEKYLESQVPNRRNIQVVDPSTNKFLN